MMTFRTGHHTGPTEGALVRGGRSRGQGRRRRHRAHERAGARARGEVCHAGSYEAILPQINRLKVDHMTMEFATPSAGALHVLSGLREDLEIGLGCVSVEPGKIDSRDAIVARVEQALEVLSADRVVLNPDCGFAPGSAAKVDSEELFQKLKEMVAAAEILRDRYA